MNSRRPAFPAKSIVLTKSTVPAKIPAPVGGRLMPFVTANAVAVDEPSPPIATVPSTAKR